ncbi:MAG: alpha/beta hydrolase-fold protein, partial [Bacteroidota bacterium]
MPQLDRNRRIWIYLPPDYQSSNKSYPVLYLQDGQNLFDAFTSFSGEWEIDESLNTLFEQGDHGVIVVGIDNGGIDRINEYAPWVHPSFGGGQGGLYVDFLINTLKPYIDDNFRTRPEREATGIVGSSMGGLIALYAAIEHQDVFGKAGVFSPSLWFSDQAFSHVSSTGKQEDMRIYLLAGIPEDNGSVVADLQNMYNTLLQAGFTTSELNIQIHEDGQHSEWYWAREFPTAYEWLCATLTTATTPTPVQWDISITPNPTDDLLRIHFVEFIPVNASYRLYSFDGQQLLNRPVQHQHTNIATDRLPNGVYWLNILNGNQVIKTEKIIVH